ncbi:MAG: hypothetical protein ACRYFS_25855 [Janthinobacterium lividum]
MNSASTKTIFWVSVALLAVLLIVTVAVGAEALGLSLGHKNWGRFGGDAVFPCLIVALAIVWVAFRRLGLVEGEKKVEILRRASDAMPIGLESPVELRIPRSLWLALAGTMDAGAILFLVMVAFLPAVLGTKPAGYGVAAFFALFSLGLWYGYVTHAGMDDKGIQYDNAKPKSSVRWSEAVTCEITLVPQPWGQFFRYSFCDAAGSTLMRLILSGVGTEQASFITALRGNFN